MKRVRHEEQKTLYHYRNDLFGRKTEESTSVFISYMVPVDEAEAESFQKLYKRSRRKHLAKLQELAAKINVLERCVDEFNKRQIIIMDEKLTQALVDAPWYLRFFMPKVVPSEVLDELLLSKQQLNFLRERAFDLLDLVFEEDVSFPISERAYTTLIDIDFFVEHLNDIYSETHSWLTLNKSSKRHQLLNVSF